MYARRGSGQYRGKTMVWILRRATWRFTYCTHDSGLPKVVFSFLDARDAWEKLKRNITFRFLLFSIVLTLMPEYRMCFSASFVFRVRPISTMFTVIYKNQPRQSPSFILCLLYIFLTLSLSCACSVHTIILRRR